MAVDFHPANVQSAVGGTLLVDHAKLLNAGVSGFKRVIHSLGLWAWVRGSVEVATGDVTRGERQSQSRCWAQKSRVRCWATSCGSSAWLRAMAARLRCVMAAIRWLTLSVRHVPSSHTYCSSAMAV